MVQPPIRITTDCPHAITSTYGYGYGYGVTEPYAVTRFITCHHFARSSLGVGLPVIVEPLGEGASWTGLFLPLSLSFF